jgi:hypothetical protein
VEFRNDLTKAGVENQVVPMMMTSEDAVRVWDKPIRLLWIDGDHRYEPTWLDFTLWEPHLAEGGSLLMNDTIRKEPKRVLWEKIFCSGRFQEIAIVDNITAVRKVKKASSAAIMRNYGTFVLRALYIVARKTGRAALENRRSNPFKTVDPSDLAANAVLHDLLEHCPIMEITSLGAIFFSFVAD